MLRHLLAHPLVRGLDVNDPYAFYLRGRIISKKPFLRKIYKEWYLAIASCIPPGEGFTVEIGSGGGIIKEVLPEVITSDVFHCSNLDIVLDGSHMAFSDSALKAVVMTDVFHHIPQPGCFLNEAARCVRPGGVLVMIEPWVTTWSRFIYGRLHYEPFEPNTPHWEFPNTGPLSGGNSALPWIVFHRDRSRFDSEFPQWRVRFIKQGLPFRYILSGGVSLRALMPEWSERFWRSLEEAIDSLMPSLAMFAQIVLDRV